MSELPPAVREHEFLAVNIRDKEAIRSRFDPFVRDLHSFLNRASCLRDIQRIRHAWNSDIREQLAFKDFNTEPKHWYTHHAGGRNEAQFNIGFSPNYLRVGLGFEFTQGTYGKPGVVQNAYGAFTDILRQHRQAFDRFVEENYLEVEWRPLGKRHIEHVSMQRVSRWLLRPKPFDWIFIGRLLRRERDAEILADPVRLKEIIESVFGGLKDFWEQAQGRAYGFE